jgi:glucans biosynthesis protein C
MQVYLLGMQASPVTSPERRYDIDWLRIFATYLLFPFHVGKVFDVPPYYPIKSPDLSPYLGYFTMLVHQFHMPLFFLLAGWSLHASMHKRGGGGVLRERVDRILIPFLFGTATLCLVIGYYERVLMPGLGLTFFQYVPKFFTSLDFFTWSHLWFLIYLFTFTLLWLPLFKRMLRASSTLVLRRSWYIYRPIPALFLMQGILRIWWPGFQNLYNDWGNFCYYSVAMIIGFWMGCQPAIAEAIDREKRRAAVIAFVAAVLLCWTRSFREWPDELRHVNYYFFGTLLGYTMIIALLGYARLYGNVGGRVHRYLAESALPVYILHQAGIVITGWIIIHWGFPLPVRYALVLAAAVLSTMAVYHLLIRPFWILRRLFGMKGTMKPVD